MATKRAASKPSVSKDRAATRSGSAKGGRTRAPSAAGTGKAGRSVARSKAGKPERRTDTTPRPGLIAHTEFISNDPEATKRWLEDAVGLDFMPSMDMGEAGPYHMWSTVERTGGGIRGPAPNEAPGAIPYIEVKSIKPGFRRALAAGAQEVMAPMEIPGGHGWMAIVKAPGGPMVGLWSNK